MRVGRHGAESGRFNVDGVPSLTNFDGRVQGGHTFDGEQQGLRQVERGGHTFRVLDVRFSSEDYVQSVGKYNEDAHFASAVVGQAQKVAEEKGLSTNFTEVTMTTPLRMKISTESGCRPDGKNFEEYGSSAQISIPNNDTYINFVDSDGNNVTESVVNTIGVDKKDVKKGYVVKKQENGEPTRELHPFGCAININDDTFDALRKYINTGWFRAILPKIELSNRFFVSFTPTYGACVKGSFYSRTDGIPGFTLTLCQAKKERDVTYE